MSEGDYNHLEIYITIDVYLYIFSKSNKMHQKRFPGLPDLD